MAIFWTTGRPQPYPNNIENLENTVLSNDGNYIVLFQRTSVKFYSFETDTWKLSLCLASGNQIAEINITDLLSFQRTLVVALRSCYKIKSS